MKYLLDTNAFVDHLRRGPNSNVTAGLLRAAPGSVYLCTVVLAELIFGAIRSGVANESRNRAMIARLTLQFPPVCFDESAAEEYAKLRAHLTSSGQIIGPNDMMIAAIALAKNMTLVSHNVAEFQRVPGLRLEDWE